MWFYPELQQVWVLHFASDFERNVLRVSYNVGIFSDLFDLDPLAALTARVGYSL